MISLLSLQNLSVSGNSHLDLVYAWCKSLRMALETSFWSSKFQILASDRNACNFAPGEGGVTLDKEEESSEVPVADCGIP